MHRLVPPSKLTTNTQKRCVILFIKSHRSFRRPPPPPPPPPPLSSSYAVVAFPRSCCNVVVTFPRSYCDVDTRTSTKSRHSPDDYEVKQRLNLIGINSNRSSIRINSNHYIYSTRAMSTSSPPSPPLSFLSSFSKEASTAPMNYPTSKRWMAIPPANLVHLSIGAVYVYAMWTPSLTTVLGVVSQSAQDWTHSQVIPVFSVAAVTLGITTSVLGSWVERVGPRMSGLVGSIAWGMALLTSSIGVHIHSLPLVYSGYGLFGGIGWGLMYLTPVTTCMKWFPDRRGLATGLALSAFGLGAAIAPPVIQATIDYFFIAPDFVGDVHSVTLHTLSDGSQVIAQNSPLGTPDSPAIVATSADAAKVSLSPGVYDLNTGDTGTSKALATLGILYGSVGAIASRFMKVPSPGWKPEGYDVDETSTAGTAIGIPADVAIYTNQFPLLWLAVFGNACGGLALLSSSKLMITDIWAGVMPHLVTASFATGYVAALGSANAIGRFGWAFASDYIGRKKTYMLFALGMPVVGGAPYLCHMSMNDGMTSSSVLPLAAFCGGSVLAISFYGGIFSVLPAYISDLWGQRHAGAIHGKALTAWAAAAVGGPMGLAYLRSVAVDSAMEELLNKIDPETFQETFECDVDEAQALIDAKTVTISRLMEIAPEGTVDPTPFLYDNTCYIAAGLIGVSALSNLLIKPVDVKRLLTRTESTNLEESNEKET